MKNLFLDKIVRILAVLFIALSIFTIFKVNQAKAFDFEDLIDPFCLWTCDDDSSNSNPSNNPNPNYNHPGINTPPYSVPTTRQVVTQPTIIVTPPTQTYTAYTEPIYPAYSQGYQYLPTAVSISCYPSPSRVSVGNTVIWNASVTGGNGNYYITWSGNDGLSGYGSSVSKIYNNYGSKYASVTVTSGNQTSTQNCSTNVDVIDNNYNSYNYNSAYNYNPYSGSQYYYNNDYYNNNNNAYYNNSPLYVNCNANTNSTNIGSNVIWQANVSGGNGYYSYNWSGTDYLSGYGKTLNVIYNSIGIKVASVIVTSGNQSVTQTCSNSVNINQQNYSSYVYSNNYLNTNTNTNSNNMQIACYADKVSAKTGIPVTWAVEVIGGGGNYAYSWSGSDSLSGDMASIVKTYYSTGSKNATIKVTSSSGQSASQMCGNVVNISNTVQSSNNTVVKSNVKEKVVNNKDESDSNVLSAASLFSLQNVPWGWVAVLVILVLLFTVLYLIYNRNKI